MSREKEILRMFANTRKWLTLISKIWIFASDAWVRHWRNIPNSFRIKMKLSQR